MTDAGLGEWYRVAVGAEGRVTELELARNTWQGLSRLSFSSFRLYRCSACTTTS